MKGPSVEVLLGAFDEAAAEFSEVETLCARLESERYEDGDLLGEGGAKFVYLCEDKVSGREIVRAYPRSEELEEDFLREALLHAQLEHPNIIPLYDMGYEEGRPFFCMQRISGRNLSEWLNERGLSLSEVLDVMMKVADAVGYAHDLGVLHLDIKPTNVQLSEHGEVFVGDWGLARSRQSGEGVFQATGQFTRHGLVCGTPGFMAPEQCEKGRVRDARTDVFGLGALLYYMLSGCSLVVGGVEEGLEKMKRGEIDFDKVDIDARLLAILKKMLAIEPEDRYQSVKEVLRDLAKYRNGALTSVDKSSVSLLALSLWRRKKSMIIPSLVGLFLVVGISVAYIVNLRAAEQEAVASAERTKRALNELAVAKNEKLRGLEVAAANYLRESSALYVEGSHGRISYDPQHSKKAYPLVVKALDLKPDNKEAWGLRGKLEILLWKLDEAAISFGEAGEKFKILQKACEEFKGLKKGDTRKIVDFLHTILPSQDLRLIHDVMFQVIFTQEQRNFDDVLYFIEESLNMRNGGHELRLNYTFDKRLMSLDMSHNPKLRWVFLIKNLPIRELNISHTQIDRDLEHLANLPLVKVDLSYTGLTNRTMKYLEGKGIVELNLESTRVSSGLSLKFLPLQKLNIAKTRIRDFAFLADFTTLKEVVCDASVVAEIRRHVASDVQIIGKK